MSTGRTIRLTEEDKWWVARDEETGVTSQGRTRTEAIENLDGAVALYNGEIGRPPTDEELQEGGIDPEKNRTAGDLPSVLSGPIDGDGDTADDSSEDT
jgi:predicted RNase H-like HicB family nuclease